MSLPGPDQIGRQIDRSRALLDDLERLYRLAYEVGYSPARSDDGVRRGRRAAADPTAAAALSGALQDERQLLGAAATRMKEAQRALQGAIRDVRDALRMVGEAATPAPSNGGGPLVTRAELEEARRTSARREAVQDQARRAFRNGAWADLG
jgi:hypothetical protein